MSFTVILNPYSNRWEAGRRTPEIEAGLKKSGIDFQLKQTERAGHGGELAQQ